jgi:hypothetical protein
MLAIGYYDRPMNDLTHRDFVALFAQLTEKVTTCCRRKFPGLRDDHIGALQLVIDELAFSWRPEFTAREWAAIVGQRLGVDPADSWEADCSGSGA